MNKALGYLALFFILGGLCLGIVALATNNWAENGDQTKGLFQSCRKHSCQNDSGYKEVLCSNNLDDDHKDEYKDDEWYIGSLGSHCCGVLFGFIGMFLWFATLCSGDSKICAAAIILVILSFVGFLIGVILWKFKYIEGSEYKDWKEGYSFWLAVGAAVSTVVAATLSIISGVSNREKEEEE